MYKVLEDMDDSLLTLKDLRDEWSEIFDVREDELGPSSYKRYMESDYYDDTTYILDTQSHICYKANDFFHMHVKEELS